MKIIETFVLSVFFREFLRGPCKLWNSYVNIHSEIVRVLCQRVFSKMIMQNF
jgi:hypothetical protein